MSTLLHAPARTGGTRRALARAEFALLALGACGLLLAAIAVIAAPGALELPGALDASDATRLAAAISVYLMSHVFRFLRLVVLLRNPGLRLRRVLQVHLFTSGLGVLLPFKLGDLVRIREVGLLTHSWRTGLLAVWLERALDATALAVLVLVTAVGLPESLPLVTPFLVVGTIFVLGTVAAITVVPENIRAVMLHLVRRPFGERSVTALRLLRATLATLHEAPNLLRGRVLTLLLLTALVWCAELAVVSIAVPGADAQLSQLSTSVLSLLSGISSGATPLMPGSSDRLVDSLRELGRAPEVGLYRLSLLLPMLIGGAAAAALYLRGRGVRS